ncbi:MAG: hypothetical protein RL432_1192 [Bacteroidota bacterium]|jgi:hypothetical protein
MTSKKNKKLKILWVGETAFEAYQSTDKHVRKCFNHEILIYEPHDKKHATKINYLKNKEDPKPRYEEQDLSKSIKTFFEAKSMSEYSLLIGSNFELLVQQVLEQLKELKEPKSYYGAEEKTIESNTEFMVFEPTLYKKDVSKEPKVVIDDAVFLKIKALFLDFEESLGSTNKNYGKYFKQTWELDKDAPHFDEFLFRYLDNKTSNNP